MKATIVVLPVAMLLRHSLGLEAEAAAVERAVGAAIERGVLPGDIAPPARRLASKQPEGS